MYSVKIIATAGKDIKKIRNRPCYNPIIRKILALKKDPRPRGCVKLTGREGYRVRVGDYRILYEIEDARRKVFVFRVRTAAMCTKT